jgi:multimeric flavodoxin WrbA
LGEIVSKKILVLSASPVKNGNTTMLVDAFAEGARSQGAHVDVVATAFLKYKASGCTSCRACQKSDVYECVIDDEAKPVLAKMARVDVIVMATPLYFYGPSAQLKLVMDRMFSLYKWNNETNEVKTPLRKKKLVLLGSAYEDIGLDVLKQPFVLTADYSQMAFESLIVPNAGESGEIEKIKGIREKAVAFGKKMAE